MTEYQHALHVMEEAAKRLEPLYTYVPNRELGWLSLMIDAIRDRLIDGVERERTPSCLVADGFDRADGIGRAEA